MVTGTSNTRPKKNSIGRSIGKRIYPVERPFPFFIFTFTLVGPSKRITFSSRLKYISDSAFFFFLITACLLPNSVTLELNDDQWIKALLSSADDAIPPDKVAAIQLACSAL